MAKDDAKDNYHNAQMAEQTAQHNFYTVNSQITQNDEKIARLQAQHQSFDKIKSGTRRALQINQSLDVITPKVEAMTHEITHAKQAQSEVQLTWQSHRDELSSLMQEKK